jgi:hypothetical protein
MGDSASPAAQQAALKAKGDVPSPLTGMESRAINLEHKITF